MSLDATSVLKRLKQLEKLRNLEEIADFLGMNASTLRSRKARNSIPYDEIIRNLGGAELLYVLKGESLLDDSSASDTNDLQQSDKSVYVPGRAGIPEMIRSLPMPANEKLLYLETYLSLMTQTQSTAPDKGSFDEE
ncbi:MAG: helix-turn-helix domain-containing protein [Balneolaceae bacterium]